MRDLILHTQDIAEYNYNYKTITIIYFLYMPTFSKSMELWIASMSHIPLLAASIRSPYLIS